MSELEQLIEAYNSSTKDSDKIRLAYRLLPNPDCPVEIIEEWMFYFPSLAIANPALDLWLLAYPDLIKKAAKNRFASPFDLIDLDGLDPDHSVTKEAIAINTELQAINEPW